MSWKLTTSGMTTWSFDTWWIDFRSPFSLQGQNVTKRLMVKKPRLSPATSPHSATGSSSSLCPTSLARKVGIFLPRFGGRSQGSSSADGNLNSETARPNDRRLLGVSSISREDVEKSRSLVRIHSSHGAAASHHFDEQHSHSRASSPADQLGTTPPGEPRTRRSGGR